MSKMPGRCALLCFLAVSVATCQMLFAADVPVPAIGAPLDLGKDIAAYVIAPDVNSLLNNADAVVKQFAPPGQYQPGMLKMLLGTLLGDPALANLGTKPAVLMVFKLPADYNPQGGPPPMALFIPATAAAPYDQVFNQQGVTAFADGVLTAASTPEALKQAQGAKGAYAKIAAAGLKSDLRVYVSVASLMETFGPIVKGSLMQAEQMAIGNIGNNPPPPGIDITPAMATKLVKLALRGVQGLAGQIDAFQIDLKLTADALTMQELLIAKDGTVLASLFTGKPAKWDKNLDALVDKGPMVGMGNLDMVSMSAALKKLVAEIAKDPDVADLGKEDIVKTMLDGVDAVGGQSLFSMNIAKDGALNVVSVGTVKDEAKYSKLIDSVGDIFKADSFISKLYAGLGMNMDAKMEKDVRERKGVKINRMTMTIDMPKAPAAQRENMKKFTKPTESAIIKGYYLSSNNTEALDGMIDKVVSGDLPPTGLALKSKTLFGEGQQLYVDYDIFAVMKAVVGNDPNNPAAPIFAKMPEGEAFLMAMAMDSGRAQYQVQIPLAPIAKVVKLFQEMGQNFQNGGPPKPKPTDDGKF